MAFCHYCDITALGCSGCDSLHTGLTTHRGQFLGLGSPTLSGKVVLNELIQHLSAALLGEESPHKASIDESLRKGTLSRFSRCLLSAAIQEYALKVSQQALPAIERILIEDEEAKAKARKAAEEAAIERARLVALKAAEETATLVATRIANELAPPEARMAAIEPARDKATEVAEEVATKLATKIANDLSPSAASQAAIQPATIKAAQVANEIVSHKLQELDTKMALDDFVKTQMTWVQNATQAEVLRRRISKAAEKAPAVTKKFSIPKEQATQVPRLALYDFLVLCDDSGSMNTSKDSRKKTQEATVRGLFNILRDLGSDRIFSIIPFEKTPHENLTSAAAVNSALRSIEYSTGAKALKPLERRILRRLEEQAQEGALPPTVVVVITDGDTGDVTDFGNAIATFKKTLRQNGYAGPAALFLICRVGSDDKAARTLEALNHNTAINDIVLYSQSQLDLKLAESEKKGDVDGYIGWVVGELLRAMELQLIPS